jgi:hypothetical protein
MVNKIIVSKYIEEKDENGFYNEMLVDANTANLLRTQIHNVLFADITQTLGQLDHFSKLGYVEKNISEINLVRYNYTVYYFYPYRRCVLTESILKKGNLLIQVCFYIPYRYKIFQGYLCLVVASLAYVLDLIDLLSLATLLHVNSLILVIEKQL